jgi:hypothetical protein
MMFNLDEANRLENAVNEIRVKTPQRLTDIVEVLQDKVDDRVSQLKATPDLATVRHLQGTILVLDELLKLMK